MEIFVILYIYIYIFIYDYMCVYVGVYHSLDRSAVIRTYGRSELRVEDRVWVQGMADMGRSLRFGAAIQTLESTIRSTLVSPHVNSLAHSLLQ